MLKMIKNIIKKAYTIVLMGFVIWYGFFITPLMFGHNERREELIKESKESFDTEVEKDFSKLLKEQTQMETVDLGTNIVNEQYLKGHFHHVGFKIEYDTHSLCVKCHGDIPHDKAKAIRAFLNMHVFFLACETCHILPQEGQTAWMFKWYDKKTGLASTVPVELAGGKIDRFGNYGKKIAPGVEEDGRFRFFNTESEREFVDKYLTIKDKLAPAQLSRMKKAIHKQIAEQPLLCDGCHTTESSYLPLEKIGYPAFRIDHIKSAEVVGIAKKYKEFYMPKFLLPQGGREDAVPEPMKLQGFGEENETSGKPGQQ